MDFKTTTCLITRDPKPGMGKGWVRELRRAAKTQLPTISSPIHTQPTLYPFTPVDGGGIELETSQPLLIPKPLN